MMRWWPWPQASSRKFRVRLVVRRLEAPVGAAAGGGRGVAAEIVWKGQRAALGGPRGSSGKRDCTGVAVVVERPAPEGDAYAQVKAVAVAEWNEEFQGVCCLTAQRGSGYQPWEVAFSVHDSKVFNHGKWSKTTVIGTAAFNIAAVAAEAEKGEIEIKVLLSTEGASSVNSPSLYLSLSLLDLRATQVSMEAAQGRIIPLPLQPTSGDEHPPEKDELSAIKAALRKVKMVTEFLSSRSFRKSCREDDSEGMCSVPSEDNSYAYNADFPDDDIQEGDLYDEEENSVIRNSFNYGTLASFNHTGGSFYYENKINEEYVDWTYHGYHAPDADASPASYMPSFSIEQPLQTSKRSILPWKRKLSFRSPKARGEPLLKKAYGEVGGDDIDYDRRQLIPPDVSIKWHRKIDDVAAENPYISAFGDDYFAVGSWEIKEVLSRDGHLKLCTQAFFASIDQRSERAAGEGACTVLVAVIADWLQTNPDEVPIKCQFDNLIREGSAEWRRLCENATHRERFPDKHFDLDTVVRAKIRPLSVAPERSFIGFFDPRAADGGGNSMFDILNGAMSFDNIWDEINRAETKGAPDANPSIYIVSWNDHFFLLKVDADAYYIVDTLGERLYEGCDRAYILKFDDSTKITAVRGGRADPGADGGGANEEDGVLFRGKGACKEYIKSFLAAIPVRELQADVSKGLLPSPSSIHRRLQIEFHHTGPSDQPVASYPPEMAKPSNPDLSLANRLGLGRA